MADESEIINPLEFDCYSAPRGMIAADPTLISDETRYQLNILKFITAKQDYNYFNKHPEIAVLIKMLLGGIYRNQPENIARYAAKFFSQSKDTLKAKLMKELLIENAKKKDEEIEPKIHLSYQQRPSEFPDRGLSTFSKSSLTGINTIYSTNKTYERDIVRSTSVLVRKESKIFAKGPN